MREEKCEMTEAEGQTHGSQETDECTEGPGVHSENHTETRRVRALGWNALPPCYSSP